MGRAYTRFQKLRAIQRAKRYCKAWDLSLDKKTVHMFAENRSPCSCYICRPEKYRDYVRKKKVEEE